MSFSPVEYVWLVPAIPLAAMLIIFFVGRGDGCRGDCDGDGSCRAR